LYEREDFIIIVSETATLASKRVTDIRTELMTNERIRAWFGDLTGPVWSQDDLVCANGVRVTAKGRGAQIRGEKHGANRPSLIVLDDIESSEGVQSPDQRSKVRDWYESDVRRAGRPDGTTNFRIIGTFLHPDALLPSLVSNPAYESKLYKAVLSWSTRPDLWSEWKRIYTDLTNPDRFSQADAYHHKHESEMLEGVSLLWPEGISYLTVQKALVTDGEYAVMKEYQNEPYDPSRQLFDMNAAVRFRVETAGLYRSDGRRAKWEHITGASVFLDWSGGKDTLDNCFACVVVMLWEKIPHAQDYYTYVYHVWLDRVPLQKQIEALFDCAQLVSSFPRLRVAVEDFPKDITGAIHESVRRAFAEEKLKRGASISLEFFRRNTDKVERIAAIQPRIANGWLAFNEALPQEYMNQMSQFPTHSFMDAPDATEGAGQLTIARVVNEEPRGEWRVKL
jgi:predicted phage terminase large subunit-like protein